MSREFQAKTALPYVRNYSINDFHRAVKNSVVFPMADRFTGRLASTLTYRTEKDGSRFHYAGLTAAYISNFLLHELKIDEKSANSILTQLLSC